MKLALLICLLAFISCKKDIMTIIKCLYESPKIKELITDAITAIVTKDFTKLWENIKNINSNRSSLFFSMCYPSNDINIIY